MMRSSNFRKSEAGQILVYVTITLALTLLVVPPLLGFIFGAGRTAQIREDRMLGVYAADAGIEDGYYRLIGNSTPLPQSPDDPPWVGSILDVNGYEVAIEVYREAEDVYKIVSTATSYTGANVTIESYAAALDYSYLLDSALSSYGDITIRSGAEVHGNVTYNGELDNKGDIIGGNATKGVPSWPDGDWLKAFYYADVEGVEPYGSSQLEIEHDENMGPLYTEESLNIYSSRKNATLTLMDTFYVTGDLDIGKTDKAFVLDLNGQTIFCEGEIRIGGQCTITGSGAIIALGDIVFKPKVQSGPGDFVFVMSVSGDLEALPNGDFYGAMAGGLVKIQPGSIIKWREVSTDELAFFPVGEALPGIRAYIIRY
ncbi:MAG: hypothetical protein E3J81_06550 [Dehalococcoidia bacterium]|nr:MAG: hypothetical protein E3J81_06550 [Dehalococcoidia bacterium]